MFLLGLFRSGMLISVIAGYQSKLGFSLFTARYALVAYIIPVVASLAIRWISARGKSED